MTAPFEITIDRLGSGASDRLQSHLTAAVPAVAPAAVLAVWRDGEPVFEMAAGSIGRERGASTVSKRSLFDLASLTKLFTASAFLGLVGEGRVSLDDAVGAVIPEFIERSPRGMDGGQEPLSRRLLPTPPDRRGRTVDPASVTFRHLLTHTSGLAPWRAIFQVTGPVPLPEGPDTADRERRLAVGMDDVCASPFVADPGREVRYSDLGLLLLGETVARLTGQPLEDAVRDRVLGPLRLDSVTFLPLQKGLDRAAIAPTSVDVDWRQRRLWGEVEDENTAGLGGVAGHAGLFATANDVAVFGRAWLDGGPSLGIGPELVLAATADQTPGLGEARGLGWQVQPADYLAPLGPRAFGHTGFTGTSLVIEPDRALVVALLTNRVHAGRTHAGIEELRLAVHGAAISDD